MLPLPVFYETETLIQQQLAMRGVEVRYQPAECSKYEWFGFYDPPTKTINICPEVIKKYQGTQVTDFNNKVNEVLRHETVHYVQFACNSGRVIDPKYTTQWLRPIKKRIVSESPANYRGLEAEAHYVEEFPLLVYSLLKEKCPLSTVKR